MHKVIKVPSINVMVGPPRSGKSVTIKKCVKDLFQKGKVHYGIVFCSPGAIKSYSWFPSEFIYTEYDPQLIQDIMTYQANMKANTPNEKDYKYCVIVFDDVGRYKKQFNSELCTAMITEYRHFCLQIFLGLQYINMIRSPTTLDCITYYWIIKLKGPRAKKSAFDYCAGEFETQKEFTTFVEDIRNDPETTKNCRNMLLYDAEDDDCPHKKITHGDETNFKLEFGNET
jgi:hypothetical protein